MNSVMNIARRVVEAADLTFSCSESRKRRYAEDTARQLLSEQGQSELIPAVLDSMEQIYQSRAATSPSLAGDDFMRVGKELAELRRKRKVCFSGRLTPVVTLSLSPRYHRPDKNGILRIPS